MLGINISLKFIVIKYRSTTNIILTGGLMSLK